MICSDFCGDGSGGSAKTKKGQEGDIMTVCDILWPGIGRQAEYGFGEHIFKHRAQWAFVALTQFRGENSVSLSQSAICAQEWTHRVFSELTELPKTQWRENLYSRNSIPRVS